MRMAELGPDHGAGQAGACGSAQDGRRRGISRGARRPGWAAHQGPRPCAQLDARLCRQTGSWIPNSLDEDMGFGHHFPCK